MSKLTDEMRKSYDPIVNSKVHHLANEFIREEKKIHASLDRLRDIQDKLIQEMLTIKKEANSEK